MEWSGDLLKFSAAVQITRPKSATSHQGFPSSPNSPKQMKVAQLVLKKSIEQSNSPARPPPIATRGGGGFIERSKSDVDHRASNLMTHLTMPLKPSTTMRSKSESRRGEEGNNEKSSIIVEAATKQPQQPKKPTTAIVLVDESPHIHKSSPANEAVRREAREFMKRQKEKRKQLDETKKEEEDKSFIIKQRLAQLKITTRNVIANANKAPLSKQQEASGGEVDDEIGNSHGVSVSSKKYPTYREIHTLKLKPMSKKIQSSSPPSTNGLMANKSHDNGGPIDNDDHRTVPEVEEALQKTQCGISREQQKESEMEVNPKRAAPSAAVSFPASPVKKPHTQPAQQSLKKLVSPLQLQNHQLHATRRDVAQRQQPMQTTVNAANKKKPSIDDLKLKIPDVKLNIAPLTRQEIVPSHLKHKTPAWLQSSFAQPYPYNFIFAVKKKLEAYISKEELKKRRVAKKQLQTTKKKQKDDSEDVNTMSEISSIQSDLVLMRSQKSSEESSNQRRVGVGSNPNEANNNDSEDDDDTTISISTLNSVKNDELFVGRNRESINSEFERHRDSFPPHRNNADDLTIEDISPNTSEKQENFLSSTKIVRESSSDILTFKKQPGKDEIPALARTQVHQSDNDNHNSAPRGKEENDYRKMLDAFQTSLSQVIEVNNQLSSSVASKPSSVASTGTSSTAKSYSTLFEKAIDTESSSSQQNKTQVNENNNAADNNRESSSKLGETTSSIETFIESESTLRGGKVIVDPPIIVSETHHGEVKNNETTASQMTSTLVTKDDDVKQLTFNDNTLNESKILNILQLSDINNISLFDGNPNMDNYNEMFLKDNKKSSTKEIHSWEKRLIDRMKGEIAWLELGKQNLKKHGHVEKAALMRNLQRSLLLRMEKEREKLRSVDEEIIESPNDNNHEESVTKSEIERVLEQRENKLKLKRKQIERLVKWQQKLDLEEARLKTLERQLLGQNQQKNSSSSRETHKETENDLNISIEKVRSIDRSLEILQNIPSHEEQPEVVKVSGSKLNKLWKRLTGSAKPKFDSGEVLTFTKEKFSELYEEARLFVLNNDFEKILDVSNLSIHNEKLMNDEKEIIIVQEKKDDDNEKSEVSTMNSIANIETEEEYAGSFQDEVVTSSSSSSSSSTTRKNESTTSESSNVLLEIPKLGNLTFAIAPKALQQSQPLQKIDDLNQSNLSVGASEMEVEERDSHQTSSVVYSFEKIESSSVDIDGSIIPENIVSNNESNDDGNNIQITDMDEQEDQLLIEDISFPDYENSISMLESDPNVRQNLSTITECTEYEQSQGSSELYTDFATTTTTTSSSTPSSSSESKNAAIQNRLISINDSLTEVSEAFDRAVKPLSGLVANSTEVEAAAASSPSTTSPSKSSEENNTIQFSEHDILRHSSTGGEEDDGKKSDDGSTSDF